MKPGRGVARSVWRSLLVARTLSAVLAVILSSDARAADNVFLDLVVESTGFLVGDADDRFLVSRDFLNASIQAQNWSTGHAELVFRGGPAHLFELAGADAGPAVGGLTDNFSWGTFRLEAGQTLTLQDGNATPGGAQYVRSLVLEDGIGQISSIVGNGLFLYYNPSAPENTYLGGATYPLTGGGAIMPLAPAVTTLSDAARVTCVLALLAVGGWFARRRRYADVGDQGH